MTIKDKYLTHFESLFRTFPNSYSLSETKNGLTISRIPDRTTQILFFLLFLVIIPIAMVVYEINAKMIGLAAIWEVIFIFRFYQILIGQNKLTLNFETDKIKIENINWMLKHFLPTHKIDFYQTVDYEIRNIRHSRFGMPSYRLKVRNAESRKIIVCDFESIDVAKRVKFLLKSINNKTAGNNGYKQ